MFLEIEELFKNLKEKLRKRKDNSQPLMKLLLKLKILLKVFPWRILLLEPSLKNWMLIFSDLPLNQCKLPSKIVVLKNIKLMKSYLLEDLLEFLKLDKLLKISLMEKILTLVLILMKPSAPVLLFKAVYFVENNQKKLRDLLSLMLHLFLLVLK